MNKKFDILIMVYIIGVLIGSLLNFYFSKSSIVLEENSYWVATKSFVSSLILLSLAFRLAKLNLISYPYLLILGIVSGNVFLELFSILDVFLVIYKTILYVILVFFIIIFSSMKVKKRDSTFPIIFISFIYAVLNYFIN
ncbi:hypothetical protein KHQ82_07780 [Mycoplasmatota bacterium]|nr:hypothetical protein KHQ82_07780 [Mycoplasmatota bacterium]